MSTATGGTPPTPTPAPAFQVPFFELHIRPLVRVLDREHMIAVAGFDLWDYDQVRANASVIIERVKADMPPATHGGPWPREWTDLFQRWIDAGFPRLQLGTVDAHGYAAHRAGTVVTLSGQGTFASGFHAWLQPDVEEGVARAYVHYWEPPPPGTPPGAPQVFRVRDSFNAPATVATIAVQDAAGRVDVPIV